MNLNRMGLFLFVYFLALSGVYSKPTRIISRSAGYGSVVVFGASYCDNGHPRSSEYSGSLQLYPYYHGRYSNGIVWVERIAKALQVPLLDYAYGGATVSNRLAGTSVPDTSSQIQHYIRDIESGNAHRGSGKVIHLMWIGINDLNQIWRAQGGSARIMEEVAAVKHQVQKLLKNPTVNSQPSEVHVVTVPPLQLVPSEISAASRFASPQSALEEIHALSEAYNQNLISAIRGLNSPSAHIHDITDLWYGVHSNPGAYGFSYGARSCLYGSELCKDPNNFIYFDSLHPSAKMHSLIAEFILKDLGSYGGSNNDGDGSDNGIVQLKKNKKKNS